MPIFKIIKKVFVFVTHNSNKDNIIICSLNRTFDYFTACDQGWHLYGGHCYLYRETGMSWTDAKVLMLLKTRRRFKIKFELVVSFIIMHQMLFLTLSSERLSET